MGKNVLLVGASGDIGSSIAEKLAASGYQLILHYNSHEENIEKIKSRVHPSCILMVVQADLRKRAAIEKLISQLVFQVDHIVFASGQAYYGLFQDTSERQMDEMLAVHVKAPWLITQKLLPSMIRNKSGSIVFITSIWGDIGASGEVVYSSVKGAQNSFVKALAKELGPSNISVNAISPGFISTKMNSHLSEEERLEVISEIPLNRAGNPEEIANLVAFLLEGKASYIHGEIIHINGGW
ncbi:SDR family oxidoreductase [Virgibacillus sp. 179-BFC.A HS]|uniref:SDR family oxidoreductase n=1 Tax=Tigheibacillus jepli TaxID=3035914 RepID=A0ABU5CIP0_9BACI|nr:SDR family oxidoreductase [Virgibacillus sp. 179-BFC.A HS]MDY0405821.1 SDR family oxidoreductase [Virgibacillus sp. 179-BFC.A HS]